MSDSVVCCVCIACKSIAVLFQCSVSALRGNNFTLHGQGVMLTIIEHFFLLYRICIPVSVWWAYFISFNVANNNLLFSPWMPNSIVIVYVYLVLQSLRAQVQDIYKAARMAWTVRRPSLLVQISFERGGLIIASMMSIGPHKIWKESRSCRGDGIWQPMSNLIR